MVYSEFSLSPSSPRSQRLPHKDSWVKTQHGFSKTFSQCRPAPQMTPCIPPLQGLTLLSLTLSTVHYLFCFCFCIFSCLSPATSPCTHTHTHTLSHSYAVNFLSIGIALYLTLHPLCLEQLHYVDEILPGSDKDRWRNTNLCSPNTSPFTYISFPQSLIRRHHILLVNYIGSIIIWLELES